MPTKNAKTPKRNSDENKGNVLKSKSTETKNRNAVKDEKGKKDLKALAINEPCFLKIIHEEGTCSCYRFEFGLPISMDLLVPDTPHIGTRVNSVTFANMESGERQTIFQVENTVNAFIN